MRVVTRAHVYNIGRGSGTVNNFSSIVLVYLVSLLECLRQILAAGFRKRQRQKSGQDRRNPENNHRQRSPEGGQRSDEGDTKCEDPGNH